MSPPVVLSVAGTDSGGAAGIAADLATFSHLGCHGACVVTAVTAQDTTRVHAVHRVPLDVVAAQVDAVVADLPVAVVKTGMLGGADVVDLVADRLGHLPLVVDPVLVATSGAELGDAAVVAAYRDVLLPVAALSTPNLAEARALAGRDGPPAELAARLADLGGAVVVTGGPQWQPGDQTAQCTDWLCLPGGRPEPLAHPGVATTHDHGTGCTYSSALAAALAQTRGHNPAPGPGSPHDPRSAGALVSACLRAADYVTSQLTTSSTWTLGRGRGPIAHTTDRSHR
ncbi:bifunctional hydroxymethylpyrimidine kinase/phosphomethylpyrimidine kinase [Nocardioides gansuensis]|uniref:Bifunctional hydroxymethylpyrimidine kinase/phosphomethylpyrimidine kinase n=1 Tax=Nocardioides gansuensis TaxID=2138300 RepID=A0A2T8F7F3_9ACTN|nr:hydroxymethylpyrimidine/phosphomethylpyrimidine kinase [Nocardioides gansuensis]PVG81635.1 bifunctional hydroxymethylpyrimidine kinase/phosphomethylpyrimidine kinase [Nocardioides gansuensis]